MWLSSNELSEFVTTMRLPRGVGKHLSNVGNLLKSIYLHEGYGDIRLLDRKKADVQFTGILIGKYELVRGACWIQFVWSYQSTDSNVRVYKYTYNDNKERWILKLSKIYHSFFQRILYIGIRGLIGNRTCVVLCKCCKCVKLLYWIHC